LAKTLQKGPKAIAQSTACAAPVVSAECAENHCWLIG
jgi:hypothetical protein